jgi:hypothetical protein
MIAEMSLGAGDESYERRAEDERREEREKEVIGELR